MSGRRARKVRSMNVLLVAFCSSRVTASRYRDAARARRRSKQRKDVERLLAERIRRENSGAE